MNKLYILTGFLVTLVIAGFTYHATANPHHKGAHGFSHGEDQLGRGMNIKRVMRHLAALDLTDEQRVEIKSLVKAGIEDSKPQRDSLKAMHQQMKKLMHADTVDEAAIKSLAAEMANIKSDLMILHINKRQQVAALLNDEQQAKLKKMKHQRMNAEED